MKTVFRKRLLAALLPALLFGVASRPVCAQNPNPQYDAVFAKVKPLEADQPTKAIDEYAKVKNESKDREVQAEALFRAGLVGYNAVTQPLPEGLSTEARTERENVLLDEARKAHDAIKQLEQNYTDTNAAKQATTRAFGKSHDQTLKEALEAEIDQRNARSFNYRLVDGLVAMTGRIPGFSYWFALALIAVLVKTLTLPLTLKMYKSQREMQKIQPLMKELQERYKDDKVKLNEQMMALYKEHGVNPFASCLPMFIQMPFLLWVYNTIRLYEFHFSHGKFLWIGSPIAAQYPNFLAVNLAHFDIPLLVLYAASNYVTMKLTPASDPSAAQQQKSMAVMMTIMMFWMFMTYKWSAAFIFYWLILNIFSAVQQYIYIYKPNKAAAATGGAVLMPAPVSAAAPAKSATVNGNGVNSAKNGTNGARPVNAEQMRPRPRRKPKR